jgi:hypothetical protein
MPSSNSHPYLSQATKRNINLAIPLSFNLANHLSVNLAICLSTT